MNTVMQSGNNNEDTFTKKVVYAIYFMYLASIVLPMLPILGVIFAYIFENDAKGILKSHFQLQIRSFWLAILYFSISAALILVLIGIPLLFICYIWWIIRNVKGLKSLVREEPVAKPKTWLF
jgi:uncharacterized membrane protein